MRSNKYNIEDLVLYAKKYGVKSAAVAFSVGKSTIYRHISKNIEKENAAVFSDVPCTSGVLLDFRFQLLIPEKIYRKKIIPKIILLTARDLNSNQFYFALCSDINNSLVSYFSDYLYYKLKNNNSKLEINFIKHSSKSCYSLSSATVNNSIVWSIPSDLLSAVDFYVSDQDEYPETDLLGVIAGEQFLNGSTLISPLWIKDNFITEYKSYLDPGLYWKNKTDPDKPFLSACNYLVMKAEKLIKQGETARAIAVSEKALSITKILQIDSKQIITKILINLAKANRFLSNHDMVRDCYSQAILLSPDNGKLYYEAAIYYLSVNMKETSKQMLDRALNCYNKCSDDLAQCRYYEILGKRNCQYEGNFRNALVNFRKMMNLAVKLQNDELLFEANGYLGNCYFKNRSYILAEEHYLKNLHLADALTDNVKLSTASYNLSLLYKDINRHDKAEAYIKQALIWARKTHDYYKIKNCLLEYANILRINQHSSASLRNYQIFITEYCKDSENEPMLYRAYNQMANLYLDMKQHRNACKYFKLTLKFVKKDKNSKLEPYILNQLAKISLAQSNESEAVRYLKKGLSVTKQDSYSLDIRSALLVNLGRIYFKKSDSYHAAYFLTEAQGLIKQIQMHNGVFHQENLFNEVNEMISLLKNSNL